MRFHGGCNGCSNELSICPDCMYFNCDWSLPDLNDKTKEQEDKKNKLRQVVLELKAKIKE